LDGASTLLRRRFDNHCGRGATLALARRGTGASTGGNDQGGAALGIGLLGRDGASRERRRREAVVKGVILRLRSRRLRLRVELAEWGKVHLGDIRATA
jgi:hypothetical protein